MGRNNHEVTLQSAGISETVRGVAVHAGTGSVLYLVWEFGAARRSGHVERHGPRNWTATRGGQRVGNFDTLGKAARAILGELAHERLEDRKIAQLAHLVRAEGAALEGTLSVQDYRRVLRASENVLGAPFTGALKLGRWTPAELSSLADDRDRVASLYRETVSELRRTTHAGDPVIG